VTAYFVKQSHRAPAVTEPIAANPSLPRACIIGAGSSGIAAAKQFHLAGVPFDCFEAGSAIGGNWVYDNPNGTSACYDTLEINASCRRMAYSDFPRRRRPRGRRRGARSRGRNSCGALIDHAADMTKAGPGGPAFVFCTPAGT
jgi:cation diffusion facilitator CzcD-associated flavoprotein CzcO